MEENIMGSSNCERSDSTIIAKSTMSVIESRSIGHVSADNKKEGGKCRHFSIRGYVAEMRKKDRKVCWPFPTVGNHNDMEKLPPLYVPEFRWWGCQSCLQKIVAKDSPSEAGMLANCHNTGIRINMNFSDGTPVILSHGDAQRLLHDFQHAPAMNMCGERKAELDASTNVNGVEYRPLLCGDKNEKEAEIACSIKEDICRCNGHYGSSEDYVNQVILRQTYGGTKDDPYCRKEKFSREGKLTITFEIDKQGCNLSARETATASPFVSHDKKASKTIPLKSKNDELIEFHKPNNERHGSAVARENVRKLKCMRNDSKKMYNKDPEVCTGNVGKMNGQHRHIMTECVISKVADAGIQKNESPNTATYQMGKLNPMDLDESDYEFSENDENLIGDNLGYEYHANQLGGIGVTLQKIKTRKVRMLTDIIRSEVLAASNKNCSSERDGSIDHTKVEGAQCKASQNSFSEAGLFPEDKSHTAIQGNDQQDILVKKKKRKISWDEDKGPSRMIQPKDAPQKVGISKGDAEIRNIDTTVTNFEAVVDTSIKVDSHPGSEAGLAKCRKDKKIVLCKKKMPKSECRQPFLEQWQESVQREVQVKRDLQVKCAGAETISLKSAEDAFAGSDQISGLQSYVVPPNNGGKHILGKKKNRIPPVDGMSLNDATGPYKSSQSALSRMGSHCSMKNHIATDRKSIMSKKCDNVSSVEGRGSFLTCEPKETSNMCNYENVTEVDGIPKISTSQCDQGADKVHEQAASDDIPMEIVELMAKNQYERRLFYAKDTSEKRFNLTETIDNIKGAHITNFAEASEDEPLALLHRKSSLMQSWSRNAGSGIGYKSKSVKPTKYAGCPTHPNGYNTINFNVSQSEKEPASMRFTLFPECQGKLSTGFQFPFTCSERNCGTQNCNWSRDMFEHRCPGSCFQPIEAHNLCQSSSRQNSCCKELYDVWSFVRRNNMSFGINSPREFLTESSNINMFSQCSVPLQKGNLNMNHGLKLINENVSHLQKQKVGFEMDIENRPHLAFRDKGNECHSKTVGPLDLYTNETISAMHLLRLMDAGACSSTIVNVNGNLEKFPKKPLILNDHHDKVLSRPEFRVSKKSEALIHPLSCDYFDKNNHPGKSFEHFPPAHMVDKIGSSLHKDGNFGRAIGFTDVFVDKTKPHSLTFQEKRKTKSSSTLAQTRSLKSQRSSFKNDISRKIRGYVSNHDLPKGFSSLGSIRYDVQSQVGEESTKHVQLEVSKKAETISPVKAIRKTEICTINRNPADFTLPEAGNIYMIEGGDLPYRKTTSIDRVGMINMDGHKRQRMKLTTIPVSPRQ
ncbi:PREDICTED: protein EMBRYONIC FLOWER 1-like [Nelumbo nucifera]|uniref:Protein EMBRYONIC FLOWER 1-like n=2 Tax=Nelumbo nucifera TaxID=4432 RepID=A0A1U7ZQ75_NELNU|nr:PREDICTED: protein EMBRYONIC FLOWER 1-like [Nelumbo nucifera]DAD26875.1 TPA_asm: hypothetical protein HUJ06_028343 [Nelumbo nucifera]